MRLFIFYFFVFYFSTFDIPEYRSTFNICTTSALPLAVDTSPEMRPRNIENQGGGPSLGSACKTGVQVHERCGPTSSGLAQGRPPDQYRNENR